MFVNAHWLKKNLHNKNVKVIDSSWYLPNSKRNALKEYFYSHIPRAVFFDIDKICCRNTHLPHMLPNKKLFEYEVSKLGICDKDMIIVYCKDGIKSSPRVWWTFKYFGHKNIFILNGGFKAWKLVNGKHQKTITKKKVTYFKVKKVKNSIEISYEKLKEIIDINKNYLILDGRPLKRFSGEEPEPRKNIGKGIIPGSLNIPHEDLQINGFIKFKTALKKIFHKINISDKTIICTCGSGVNACNIAVALYVIGNRNYLVFDGSWTEWFLKTKS